MATNAEKMNMVLALAQRKRDDGWADLGLKVRGDEPGSWTDLQHIDGVPGRLYIRIKDLSCRDKETLQALARPIAMDLDGRRTISQHFMDALVWLVRQGRFGGCRLPVKAVDADGRERVEVLAIDRTDGRGDVETLVTRLDAEINPPLAAVLYDMIDDEFGISSANAAAADVEDDAKNSFEQPVSDTETS